MERLNICSEFLRNHPPQELRWKNKTRIYPQKRLFKCIQNICLSFCDRLFFLSCNRSMIVYNYRNVHSLCCLHERPWHKSRSIENNEIRFFRGDNIFECRYKFRKIALNFSERDIRSKIIYKFFLIIVSFYICMARIRSGLHS